jgi:multidrug resistance efflux pump
MHPRADAGTRRLLAGDGPVSDAERTAQEATGSDPLPDYVHALMQQDQAEILSLRAALDEANTDLRQLRDIQERLVTRELFDEVLAERNTANQNLRTLEKTVANLESGLRYEQAARERVREIVNQMSEMDGIGSEPLRYWAARITSELDSGR